MNKNHLHRSMARRRLVFWTVWLAFVAAGIGYGLGRWPDVVARMIAVWL